MTKRQSHPLSQADNQTASGKTATSVTAEPTSPPAGGRSPEPELVLCGEPSPIEGANACPLEKDHDGEHYCWGEGRVHGNTYGITVMTFTGEKVAHLTMEGRTEPEGVCALLALMEVLQRKIEVPHEPITGGLLHPPCCPHCPGGHV